MRILLHFASGQSPLHRARLEYAFRVFCAVYDHEPVIASERDCSTDVKITYADNCQRCDSLLLTNGYVPRPTSQPAPPPIPFARADEETVLHYGPDAAREPDWLAEIFEWISCADEYSIKNLDSCGRLPFASSYIGRHNLNLRRPYAAIAMRLLQSAICRLKPRCPSGPSSPTRCVRHFVVNTHDVDFLPVSRKDSFCRLARNALISLAVHGLAAHATVQAKQALRLVLGRGDTLDQFPALLQKERERQLTATYFFLCRKANRRDGNYSIASPATAALMTALQPDMEVGVHGSYCSLDEPGGLAMEFDRLRELGFNPIGSRQHWLRFTVPQLVQAVQRAGAAYDASIGWSYEGGYRAGACFAFPIYDFQRETAASFLEIPLVLMDLAVLKSRGEREGETPVLEALATSRRYGWGGISILWHPTALGGAQYPVRVGSVFWKLLSEAARHEEAWLSGAAFVRTIWQRYVDVGLLPARRLQ